MAQAITNGTRRSGERLSVSRQILAALVLVAAHCLPCGAVLKYPGTEPGPARAWVAKESLGVSNQVFSAQWSFSERGLWGASFRDAQSGRSLTLTGEVFQVVLNDGYSYRASELRPTSAPATSELKPLPSSSRLAGRIAGRKIEINLTSTDGR